MKKVVGLDFETETDNDNNCRPLICCLNGKNYEETFNLLIPEENKRFYWTLVISGHQYVVFNASFDVEIIIIELLKMGFKFLLNGFNPSHKTMKLLMGQKIYMLTTYFELGGKLIESKFIDLANIIVGASLEEVARTYTDLEKGNYEEEKQDFESFKKYCMLDAKITRVAYENVIKMLGTKAITIGSAAFSIMLNMNYTGRYKADKMRQFKRDVGNNDLEFDDYIRQWYAGGLGWASTDERTEVKIHSYDIVSAYPAVSVRTIPTSRDKMTIGGLAEPTSEYPFAFIHMKVTGEVKENRVPILPSRNIYGDSNIYLYDDKDVYIIKEYGVKSEYDYFMENTDIEHIEYVKTVLMKSAKHNPLEKYMKHYYEKKRQDTGVQRDLDKRLLNSLTGKLGTNPRKENIVYRLDETNRLVKDSAEETIIEVYATHVISVITSRVRCMCYEQDVLLRDKVSFRMYATDSVKHEASVKVIKTGNNLGDWDIEYDNVDFIFLGLKAYIFDSNNEQGKRKVMCAGISKKYKNIITNEQFYASTTVKSLISMRAGNGRIIYEGFKQIASPVKKARRRKDVNHKEDRKFRLKKNAEGNKQDTINAISSKKSKSIIKSIRVRS